MGPAVRRCWDLLFTHRGSLVSHTVLRGPTGSRAADMAMVRLRAALPRAAAEKLVQVRGAGWVLLPEEEPHTDLGWAALWPQRRWLVVPSNVVRLSRAECTLLVRLAGSGGRPVDRATLAQEIWGRGAPPARLDVLLCRLRARIEEEPERPRRLLTLPGLGVALIDSRRALPARALAAPPPRPPPLVGRDSLLQRATQELDDQRVLLLHGPPGIGKSGLAAAIAASWWDRRGGAVVRIDLHDLDSAGGAEARLAGALKLDDLGAEAAVVRALKERGPLLVILDGAAPLALTALMDRWVGQVPQLRVLATARTAVATWGTFLVPPLDPMESRALYERVAGRSLDADNDAAWLLHVAGNPLAIHLLARAYAVGGGTSLRDRADLPLVPLLRAWRAVLDPLSPTEALVARAASMFRSTFTTASLDALLGLGSTRTGEVVSALAARSILVHDEDRLVVPAPAREVLLSFLRRDPEYGLWKVRFAARLGVELDTVLTGINHRGGPALDELDTRWPDFDTVLDLGPDAEAVDVLRLCTIAREGAERATRHRRSRWIDQLRAQGARPDLHPGVRARVLQAHHNLLWETLGREQRVALLQQACALAEAGGDELARAAIAGELASVVAFAQGLADAQTTLRLAPMPEDAPVDERIRRLRHEGRLAGLGGDAQAGLATLRAAVDLAFDHGLPILEARCLVAYGQALSASAVDPQAELLLRRAVRLCDDHGLVEQGIRALIRLAQHLLRLGHRAEAAELLAIARPRATLGGWTVLLEQAVTALGFLAIGDGRIDDALAELDFAHALCAELGGGRMTYVALCNRGLAHALARHSEAALTDLRAALTLPGAPSGWLRVLGLAYLCSAEQLAAPEEPPPSRTAALDALHASPHPAAPALRDVLLRFEPTRRDRTDTLRWAEAWRGPAEIDGVIHALRLWCDL